MSYGLTPYEFVQQVFYAQEKVILDFRPDDDKYKEVLLEANLVLQELQKEEDWSWLRKRLILGPVDTDTTEIPEFELPDWVYKPSTLHDDCVRLYRVSRGCHHGHHHCHCNDCDQLCFNEWDFFEVPYKSLGTLNGRSLKQQAGLATNVPNLELGACVVGDTLTFNRPLFWQEKFERIAVADMQARIPLLHVCNSDCPRDEHGMCTLIEDRVFTEIPDPNYVVLRTAALHAEGSPPAQGRVQSLVDNAQKLLSAMRQNDAASTDADYLDWDVPTFINVV